MRRRRGNVGESTRTLAYIPNYKLATQRQTKPHSGMLFGQVHRLRDISIISQSGKIYRKSTRLVDRCVSNVVRSLHGGPPRLVDTLSFRHLEWQQPNTFLAFIHTGRTYTSLQSWKPHLCHNKPTNFKNNLKIIGISYPTQYGI